ncbi:MAG: hypothetical protein LBJ46_09745 [Planctomycetota bacterium]|jgi:tetratricopeptide (TPR) repeat protein|nr:hypothetical protein [Planctomycetota bacterium]
MRIAGLSVFAAFVSVLCAAGSIAAEIQWANLDFAAAGAQARAEGKLVHIFVEGDHCPPCDAFKRSHLADPAYIDYVSTLFVNIRVHESDPAGQAFLASMNLAHSAVPRFYVLSPEGSGVSMSIGMVAAPPMEGADVLSMASGKDLPIKREAAASLAMRLRAHAARERAAGAIHPDNPLRHIGLAALEAQAWALAGRPDEAENAFGGAWATQLVDQDVRNWYVNFWVGWRRNLDGALSAANEYRQLSPEDPNGWWLMGTTLATLERYGEAADFGERLAVANPQNARLAELVRQWRSQAVRIDTQYLE